MVGLEDTSRSSSPTYSKIFKKVINDPTSVVITDSL